MDPYAAIQELVEAAYECLAAYYAGTGDLEDRVNFEATFMTKSYQDGYITIAGWANRDSRAPKSLLERAAHPDIYNASVTAQIYRDSNPRPQIVEDTDDPRFGYVPLYAGQTDRIKSSIVYPVLSARNVVLGTLVIHCDRAGFFREADRKFWLEVLEVYAARIALEKLRLDGSFTIDLATGTATSSPKPF